MARGTAGSLAGPAPRRPSGSPLCSWQSGEGDLGEYPSSHTVHLVLGWPCPEASGSFLPSAPGPGPGPSASSVESGAGASSFLCKNRVMTSL